MLASCYSASPLKQAHTFWHPPALHQAIPLVWCGQSLPRQAGLSPTATTPGTLLTGTCRSGGGLFSGATVSTQVIFSISTEPFLLPRRCKRQSWFKWSPSGDLERLKPAPLPVQAPPGLCAGKGQL